MAENFQLNFNKSPDGLLPVIIQENNSNEILMQAYINQEAWNKTLQTGKATFWSRSRDKIWVKGEESGNFLQIRQILVDCDLDCVIFKVEMSGEANCHLGYKSCYFRTFKDGKLTENQIRIQDPKDMYKD